MDQKTGPDIRRERLSRIVQAMPDAYDYRKGPVEGMYSGPKRILDIAEAMCDLENIPDSIGEVTKTVMDIVNADFDEYGSPSVTGEAMWKRNTHPDGWRADLADKVASKLAKETRKVNDEAEVLKHVDAVAAVLLGSNQPDAFLKFLTELYSGVEVEEGASARGAIRLDRADSTLKVQRTRPSEDVAKAIYSRYFDPTQLSNTKAWLVAEKFLKEDPRVREPGSWTKSRRYMNAMHGHGPALFSDEQIQQFFKDKTAKAEPAYHI